MSEAENLATALTWQSPKVEKCKQGVKILWFGEGDVFVAQRFADKYVCMQPSEVKILQEPILWAYCPVPEPYEGIMFIGVEGSEPMMVDEFEKKFPKDFAIFVSSLKDIKFKSGTVIDGR